MASTNPARGMRDFLPSDVRKRNYVIGIIKEVYESYGFEPLETPAVENIETLMGKYGDEGNQLIFKILKRGEKLKESLESGVESLEQETPTQDSRLKTQDSNLSDLALRYDLTVPLARVVANHKNDLPKFFKRYQIQPVWRADRPARGRYREFYQCDVDAIGSNSMVVEADIISAVCNILTELNFTNFQVRINHRGVLTGILEAADVPLEQHSDALIVLDKLDKIGRLGVEKEFRDRGVEHEAATKLLTFFEYFIKEKSNLLFSEEQKLKLVDFQKQIEDQTSMFALISEVDDFSKVDKDKLERISKWYSKRGNDAARVMRDLMERVASRSGIEVIEEMLEKVQAEEGIIDDPKELAVVRRLKKLGVNKGLIAEAIRFTYPNPNAVVGLGELIELIEILESAPAIERIVFDPTLARGLSYYTGTIMEINVPDLAGSLGGGGRYDGLIGMFGKEQIPACGFSLGLERILVVMEERGMFPPEIADSTPADVMVTIWNEETIAESLKLADELRASGLRVTVYPEADKLGKQIKYADTINVPFVCILGDEEVSEHRVKLKDMASGEEWKLTAAEIGKKIKK